MLDSPAERGGSDLVRLAEDAGGAAASCATYSDTAVTFEPGDEVTVHITNSSNGAKIGPHTFQAGTINTMILSPFAGDLIYWSDFTGGGWFNAYAYYPKGAYSFQADQGTREKLAKADYLVGAEQTGIMKTNYSSTKRFTFAHQTAKVTVTLKAGAGIPGVTGAAVEFYGYTAVTPNTATGAITGSGPATNAITPYKSGDACTALMIPNVYTAAETFLKVTYDGMAYTWRPSGTGLALEGGNIYNFTITVEDDGISVEAAGTTDWIAEWEHPAREGMVYIRGGTITGSFSNGAFKTGRTVTLSRFYIAKYETTWKLWKEVYDYATNNRGYIFSNSCYEGHELPGTSPGTGTTNTGHGWTAVQKEFRPVTKIGWRDAIVWCNAYSEYTNLQPVYYYNSQVIKDSTYITACDDGRCA